MLEETAEDLARPAPGRRTGRAEDLRLRFYPSRGGRADMEGLPLPFALGQFAATHDRRRAVGIVERRRSDVFLVRNFDPRNRR